MKKKVECKYTPSTRNYSSVDVTSQASKVEEMEDDAAQPAILARPAILQAIPEASLLHAENMLALSKNLFMNRSPDIPSPWPHWSTYASEQVPEPSILRTAFNDLHTLAVSVTKRLMQTAVMQATSRLRSQRRRTKKGVMPFVKKRDVLSAIDVLGLKRNARSQWTGAARRCNVRVFDEQRTTKYKIKQREVSWDQAEQILGLYDAVTAPYFSDAHTIGPATDTEDDGTFKQRAARTGTPLPMEHLSLSNSDLDVLSETSEPESESALPVKMEEESRPYGQHRNRDPSEWNASVAPREADQEHAQEAQSLEQFDRQASKREAEALSRRLGFSASLKGIQSSGTMSEADDVDESIDLIASQDDWRKWTEYQATWEEFQTPVPSTSFIANQKSNKASTPHINQLRSLGDEFPEDSDASSTSSRGPQQPKKRRPVVVELRTRDPRAYAALQSNASGIYHDASSSDQSDSDDNLDADVPAQSVENTEGAQNNDSQDAMEWET